MQSAKLSLVRQSEQNKEAQPYRIRIDEAV